MIGWPRITLVTPSFNQAAYLEATLDSVLSQGYPNLQYMVVDGGSSDGSVDIIRRHARHLDWWISERDSGQADAIAKGFARADGVLMNWLNSDDCLRPGALSAIAECWRQSAADLIVGRDRSIDAAGRECGEDFVPVGYRFPECLRFWKGSFRYHQPPTFFSRRIHDAVGGLDTSLHYAMDYDLYCRMLRVPGVRVEILDHLLSSFRLHADAKTARHRAGFLDEMAGVSRRLWPVDWIHEDEARAMRRHGAECSILQAADSLRHGDLTGGLRACARALGRAPLHALMFASGRLRTRIRHQWAQP